MSKHYEEIIEEIKKIKDVDKISDDFKSPTSKVINKQKVYFWVRLYLKDEDVNIEPGDDVVIKWTPSGEELNTKFMAYGKKGLDKDHDDEVTEYINEDDKKILSLMIDTKKVNFNNDIPFIRTLFKTGYHYEYQLVKRSELLFINKKNNMVLGYYDCDF